MRCIIAGSRSIKNRTYIFDCIANSNLDITEIVSGRAHGVDRAGEEWAELCELPVVLFPADWDLHGKSAGYKRNTAMAHYASGLIAIWDGRSKGTKDMINLARKNGLEYEVWKSGKIIDSFYY